MAKNDKIDYTATEAALLLLNDYRQRQQQNASFNNYDKAMAGMRRNTGRKIDTLGEPLKTVASRLFEIADSGFFLIQVYLWKIDYLAEALVSAIESRNPLALANNTRALVEHLAAFF